MNFNFLALGRNDGAGDEVVGKGRRTGNDDDDLVDIGGNQFLPRFVGAVKQLPTWQDVFDDALILGCTHDFYPVTTGDIALFAARYAG